MITIGNYQVNINTESGKDIAIIEQATIQDMPTNWDFKWLRLWEDTDFKSAKENIFKLSYNKILCGLLRYTLYTDKYNYLTGFIEHLEASPTSRNESENRLAEPIGKWLMWYGANLSLKYCENEKNILWLFSTERSKSYYEDIIEMEYTHKAPSGTSGEDLYAFKFTKENAKEYCEKQEKAWGKPTLLRC